MRRRAGDGMSLFKALLLLAIDAAAVFGLGAWLSHQAHPAGAGILWGAGAGTIAALSAIGGAFWAGHSGMKLSQALAVVVVGFLFRMLFLTVWLVVAVSVGEVDTFGFLGGFGAVYLVGQILEVAMLLRLNARRVN
jgi:hypothetical protein